ncbi:DUF2513 domain-containing protein [Roseiconus nitratireducens]|uniref:DUF2513 domain-containing protein n=2 Tax=Roseiconus nitratireducens TaxID=2605748 RepID=A0A5M6CYW9_9BACT|nr:DUF2513 domain-containing protein [Roseiconus nitratireducens]
MHIQKTRSDNRHGAAGHPTPPRRRAAIESRPGFAPLSCPVSNHRLGDDPGMRRDFVLIRKLLLFVEERGSRLYRGSIPIEGYERDAVVTHLYLLADGGFIELGQETLSDRGPLVLTWKGCDYLDKIRGQGSTSA